MNPSIAKWSGAILLVLITAQSACSQFTGKLVYEVIRPDAKLVMTYFQEGGQALMQAYSVKTKNGVPDMPTLHAQDTIIFNISKATETHLMYRMNRAMTSPYTFSYMNSASLGLSQQIDIQKTGQETVNGYNSGHFVMTKTVNGHASKIEVWITQDLGPAPSIYVMGGYLYYTPGYAPLTRLIAAGGDGVVVKVIQSDGSASSTVNLVSADKKPPPAALFQIPTHYMVIDNSNMTPPKGPGH